MIVAGALHAAASIKELDETNLQSIKDGVGTAISAGLGAGLVPGAVLAPIVVLAVNKALDYAWKNRDFAAAANMLRGSLETSQLNHADFSIVNNIEPNLDKAARQVLWINAAVHCMGHS